MTVAKTSKSKASAKKNPVKQDPVKKNSKKRDDDGSSSDRGESSSDSDEPFILNPNDQFEILNSYALPNEREILVAHHLNSFNNLIEQTIPNSIEKSNPAIIKIPKSETVHDEIIDESHLPDLMPDALPNIIAADTIAEDDDDEIAPGAVPVDGGEGADGGDGSSGEETIPIAKLTGKGKGKGKGKWKRDSSRDSTESPKAKGICHMYVRNGNVPMKLLIIHTCPRIR